MPTAAQKKAAEAEVEKSDAEKAAEAAKAAAKTDPAPLPEPEKGNKWFINKGTENAHTENGRCMPGQRIQLTAEQAKQYSGLEPCQ